MGNLIPYLLSQDAREQSRFYVQALGGEIISAQTHEQLMGAQHEFKDKIMHLHMTVAGGCPLFMSDALEPFEHGPGIALSVSFPAESVASEAFSKLAEGGRVIYPIEMQPFGVFYGELTDRFGVRWMITAEQPETAAG